METLHMALGKKKITQEEVHEYSAVVIMFSCSVEVEVILWKDPNEYNEFVLYIRIFIYSTKKFR